MTGALQAGALVLALLLALALAISTAEADEPPRDAYAIADTAALLKLLDFARPELAPVKAALDRGDVALATPETPKVLPGGP
jgi:hypothetical protein